MTAPQPPRDFQTALRALRERFLGNMPGTLDRLRALALQLDHGPDAAEAATAVRNEAHRIRGTAGSFGFLEATDVSTAMEHRAERWLTVADEDVAGRGDVVRAYVLDLERILGFSGVAD